MTVLGDCVLDVSVAASAAVEHGGDVPAAISIEPGGQAANIAVRLARRGAAVRLVASFADDLAATLMRRSIAAEGIELEPIAAARTGAVVVLRTTDGERTMLSDREPLPPGWATALAHASTGADWLVCSGYALLDPAAAEVATALGSRAPDVRLAVAGAAVPPHGADKLRGRIVASRPDLVVLSRAEAQVLGPALPGLVVVTDPDGGEVIGGASVRADVRSAGAVTRDATGAGDAFVAALLVDLAAGPWPPAPDALRAALRSAVDAGSSTVAVTGAQGRIPGERPAPGATR